VVGTSNTCVYYQQSIPSCDSELRGICNGTDMIIDRGALARERALEEGPYEGI
jgi:hypothetical protein